MMTPDQAAASLALATKMQEKTFLPGKEDSQGMENPEEMPEMDMQQPQETQPQVEKPEIEAKPVEGFEEDVMDELDEIKSQLQELLNEDKQEDGETDTGKEE